MTLPPEFKKALRKLYKRNDCNEDVWIKDLENALDANPLFYTQQRGQLLQSIIFLLKRDNYWNDEMEIELFSYLFGNMGEQ